MTEKTLPCDHATEVQETYYWCGPTSAHNVLTGRGVNLSQGDLAREIGTTVNGTDYVGLIERVLNRHLPEAKYTSVYIENDPPTAAQREALWANVVRSINAGYGVVMNWVAPPSNYPRGVKGSPSPSYSGGTVYHYVACMGYDDTPGARALWIVDSGFRPFEYWISFDQAATLIPPKGYAYSASAPAAPTPAQPAPDAVDVLSQAMGGRVSRDRYAALLPAVAQALDECQCNTVDRVSMWLAQIGHESGGLLYMEEIADGSAYEGRGDLGNTQPGDGVRFKGRGPIQITGRSNYARLSQWAFDKGLVPSASFFVDQPAQLASDRYGFLGVIWYWTVARPNINAMCDANDLEGVTRAINGGLNGLDDRRNRWNSCRAMGEAVLAINNNTRGDDPLSALSAAEQRELLDLLRWLAAPETGELRKLFASRSMYRDSEVRFDTVGGFNMNVDAMSHEERVEAAALRGEPWAVALVKRLASGQGPGARTADGKVNQFNVDHARAVLAKVPALAAQPKLTA